MRQPAGVSSEAALKAIGLAQSFESALRFSVAVIFRLLLGYTAGLPPTAISLNSAVALGLGVVLEIPGGLIADVFGAFKACIAGYLLQAAAALSLFAAIAAYPENPDLMWSLVVLEGVLDAMGNALLSGSREVAYRTGVSHASAGLPPAEKARLETHFLALSEQYGRILLIVIPSLSLLSMYFLVDRGGLNQGLDRWLLPVLACGWIYLAINIDRIGRRFGTRTNAPRHGFRSAAQSAVRVLRGFNHVQWGAMVPFVVLTFVFSVVHGFLPVALLRSGSSWFSDNLWFPMIALNLMFIAARLVRSFVLPALTNRVATHALVMLGCVVITGLGFGLCMLPSMPTSQIWLVAIFLFPLPYDNAHGLATRPALGVLMHSLKDTGVTTSVLSLAAACSSVLACLFSVWLTVGGFGVPSVKLIGVVIVVGGLLSITFALLMRKSTLG